MFDAFHGDHTLQIINDITMSYMEDIFYSKTALVT